MSGTPSTAASYRSLATAVEGSVIALTATNAVATARETTRLAIFCLFIFTSLTGNATLLIPD